MKILLAATLLTFALTAPAFAEDKDIIIEGDEPAVVATAEKPVEKAAEKPADKTADAKPAAKKVVETPEVEAVTMFKRICVETKGDLDAVTAKFADLEKQKIAKKLTGDEAKKATGHDTKAAWVMQSPASLQKLLASEDKDGSCNLYMRVGDAAMVRDEFKRLAVWDAVQQKSKLGAKLKTETKDKATIQVQYYEVLTEDKTKRPMYILHSADKPMGDTQHLLTYKTISSKIDAPK